MNTHPEHYSLSKRVQLEAINEGHIAIVKRIKSRIITKDAIKILEIANTIRKQDSTMKISLICNDNICSKSIKLLSENDIGIIH